VKNYINICLLFFLLSSLPGHTFENATQKGLRLSTKINQFNKGFIGEQSKMEMVLIDAHGNKVSRILSTKVKEQKNDGDRSLSTFYKPLDVQGTKMLTWTHKNGDDDQWLYLPALKRVKRISSSNKSGAFLGSEFAYEDLGSSELEKFNYKFLEEKEKYRGDHNVWVIERTPKTKSGYAKQISYISKKFMTAVIIEYFNNRNEMMKQAVFSDFKAYKLKKDRTIYRANKIVMSNLLTEKKTILKWSERKLNVLYKNTIFKKNSLKDSF